MLPIDAATRDLLMTNTIYREIILRFPDEDFEITGENIVSESFELAQSICDGKDFKLGGGVIGKMQIKVFDVSRNLVGLRVRVFLRVTYMQSGGLLPSSALTPAPTLIPGRQTATAEYPLFSGKIYRSVRNNRSTVRELTAYDKIYELSKSTFYADALTSMLDHRFGTDSVRLDSFVLAVLRTQFYDEEILLDPTARFSYNYLLLLDRPSIYAAAGNGVNALKFVQAYAEAEAGFLVCTADGSLKVKSLSELIPDSTTTRKRSVDETIRYYRELRFEEYVVQPISYAQFKYLNNKTYLYGYSKAYSWYTSDNILFRMCSSISHFVRAYWDSNSGNYLFNNLLTFRPYNADVFAHWWLEPGDRIKLVTGDNQVQEVDSFVLSRKIKGINGMHVIIEAKANEYLGNKEVEINE